MTIGHQIKLLRQSKGLTQRDLADTLYISYQAVSNWERHQSQPTADMLLAILEKYHLPHDFFITQSSQQHCMQEKEQILRGFLESLMYCASKPPSYATIAQFANLSITQICQHFPDYDALVNQFMVTVDDQIKPTVELHLIAHEDLITIFSTHMAPRLYAEREKLHLLYTRPYLKDTWLRFIKGRYKQLIQQWQPKAIDATYMLDVLITFISVWLSAVHPEPLATFQRRIQHLTRIPMQSWPQ